MNIATRLGVTSLLASALSLGLSSANAADLKVGFITSLSGPNASQGIPYSLGMKAASAFVPKVGDRNIQLIVLDDASDPSNAARNARKLVDDEKVDILIGSSSVPGTMAVASVARETKTPQIVMNPVNSPPEERGYTFAVVQPVDLMATAILQKMKATGVRTVAYIGFSDAWGDLMYAELVKAAAMADIKVVSNERFARADASVTGQILKVIATRPDAVLTGTAGTAGALPYLALAERGYKGPIYGTHALVNGDFVRVGGASVEGMLAPTGPVVVAEQLPAENPVRKVALAFRDTYQKANGSAPADAYSAYAFDAWLLFADAARRASAKGEPGTPQFREALRDALASTRDVTGTHGVYNFKPGQMYGTDERARVMVKLEKGNWKYQP